MIPHAAAEAGRTVPSAPSSPTGRRAAVLGLLVLSPISAEYLIGYGESTGRPLELLAGLLILAPLYGTAAVLVREAARTAGRGWPTVLLLSAAAGLVQAGLVDQSLFHRDVATDDPEWATEPWRTVVPGLGVDAASLLNYVGGHVVWSFAAPIAVVEASAGRLADRRWLGRGGLCAMVSLWALSAALVYQDTGADAGAGAGRLTLVGLTVVALVGAAFAVRPGRSGSALAAPAWWWVGGVAGGVWVGNLLLPATWWGLAVNVVVLCALCGLLLCWSGRRGWGPRQVLAVAGAALVVRGGLAFAVEPLGEVDSSTKYLVNAALLAGVVVLLLVAWRRTGRREAGAC
ncbi:hypothetical protein RM844_26835 [Streptomyces sp. DSM 44915]|uniref:Integral membrane protein n=1 Tax=Streptomyces chisholmiae TaxID=3075540 RepID=A0ABU2JYR6_9ACTN|nr:hypothetical protein [Streptomyces sp. DSM 44915]MDT0269901.1 hypothetical protein [Streptomyces sp. DSM 44915]